MIEIFKTNVTDHSIAIKISELICLHFAGYSASFDLEDCDRVLRVQSGSEFVPSQAIIKLLQGMGFCAEILLDEGPSAVQMMLHEMKYYPVLE
ncbi:hypothetical protein [Dyadobacter sp. CY312]|uniref:hypothetical protein n=1 Tax=Dyadobacter sp. CY312 TaxID=2907303 RepID=UPI001F3C9284|nr:hypothetical protein [Dyadobacter sp. CY312]MCE7040240.1 hypothetical protein [Dyadobacter sp. CY312]